MKDTSPLYDPIVAKVLGFDPNPPQDGLPFQIEEVAHMCLFPVNSDIALEFAGRMRNKHSADPETKLTLNSRYLLTALDTGDAITRTYYGYLPGKSAKIQRYNPVQRLTFKKGQMTNLRFQRSRYLHRIPTDHGLSCQSKWMARGRTLKQSLQLPEFR